ncbi:hypothetical protein IKE71_01475 [Candidatus Saccharibacteria bacterium]|nr:hypothetical protein [Candidatus Saccharibacteria bacterium]
MNIFPEKSLIYQLYPSTWEGFKAMTEFLPRIKALHADYIWLSPCYPSGGIDGGYDVVDYCAVDPKYGTMDDLDEFVRAAHELGIKVLMDLVPNHTSTEHPWFKAFEKGEPRYRDYYYRTKEDLGWRNTFDGESAFEPFGDGTQYYLHLFHRKQADLNWENPRVRTEFREIVKFWVERHKIDGFRIDVPTHLGKRLKAVSWLEKKLPFGGMQNYFMRTEQINEYLREIFSGFDIVTLGEVGTPLVSFCEKLAGNHGSMSAVYNCATRLAFDHFFYCLPAWPSKKRLERALKKWGHVKALKDVMVRRTTGFAIFTYEEVTINAVMLESHDHPRYPSYTMMPGREIFELLFSSNPGIVMLYQGQELGLPNPPLMDHISDYKDIQTILNYEKLLRKGMSPEKAIQSLKHTSRENARRPVDLAVYEAEEHDSHSTLAFCKKAIENWKLS